MCTSRSSNGSGSLRKIVDCLQDRGNVSMVMKYSSARIAFGEFEFRPCWVLTAVGLASGEAVRSFRYFIDVRVSGHDGRYNFFSSLVLGLIKN